MFKYSKVGKCQLMLKLKICEVLVVRNEYQSVPTSHNVTLRDKLSITSQ